MGMPRDIWFGSSEADAQYRLGDDDADNRFVLAEDTDGGTILLEYDETASEWVSRGPVNMSGNDITNVGALSTEKAQIAARTDNKAEQRIWGVEATALDFPGWQNLARFDHSGSNNEIAAASVFGVVHAVTNDATIVDVDARNGITRNSSWGTAGNTISIATDARFKIDDNDSSILYLQVNIDDEPVAGVLSASVAAGFGSSATVLDAPELTDSS